MRTFNVNLGTGAGKFNGSLYNALLETRSTSISSIYETLMVRVAFLGNGVMRDLGEHVNN
jgi:hypothetical protein